MSEIKHTPGAWRSSISKNNRLQISGDNGRQVCIVWRDEYSEANARLIAAAPGLLEALKMVVRANNECIEGGFLNHNEAVQINEAITKAEGGE